VLSVRTPSRLDRAEEVRAAITGPGADRSLIFQRPSLYVLSVERLRAEVTKAFQELELAEMLDRRIK